MRRGHYQAALDNTAAGGAGIPLAQVYPVISVLRRRFPLPISPGKSNSKTCVFSCLMLSAFDIPKKQD